MNIPAILREYDFNDLDILCISTYLMTDNKIYSWLKTFGTKSKSQNPNVLSSRYFGKPNVVKFLYDNEQINSKGKKDVGTNKVETFDGTTSIQSNTNKTNRNSNTNTNHSEITSENIKQKLEYEYNNVDDPKARAELLIKIADFTGINKTDIDLTTPTIYLPQRCSQCEFKKRGREG